MNGSNLKHDIVRGSPLQISDMLTVAAWQSSFHIQLLSCMIRAFATVSAIVLVVSLHIVLSALPLV